MAPSGGSETFTTLVARLRDEDPEIRRQAITALAEDPPPDVLERLMPLLADEDERVREAAITLLGRLPDAAEILRSFLVYSRGLAFWLRERATASIGKLSCDIVEPLARLMLDEEQDIRAAAAKMASGCRDRRILPRAIAMFLGPDDWWVRGIAAEALGNFPCPEVRQALLSRMDDPELRPSVIAALGKMRDATAAGCVVGCLSDADRGTRMAALEALAALEGPEVYAAVQKAALDDPDPALRDKALVILESHRPDSERYLRELAAAVAGACRGADPGDTGCLKMENEALEVPQPRAGDALTGINERKES